MSDVKSASSEALLSLISMALDEISEAAATVDYEVDSGEIQQIFCNHIENLIWASEQADLVILKTVAEAMLNELASAEASLNSERGLEIIDWFSNIQLHLAMPNDEEIIGLLLNPLAEESQVLVAAALQGQVTDTEPTAGDCSGFPVNENPNASDVDAVDASDPEATAFEEAEPQFDTNDMLGMLAAELHEISSQLCDLALTISNTSSNETLAQKVETYSELVTRVSTVSKELGLSGLVLICEFILDNLTALATLPANERVAPLEVLQGWPRVVIDHLTRPDDDSLCIAVIDYLEKDNWPEPLPYREMRNLIEGLTKELEMSADFEVEQREIEAMADDVSLDMSTDASPELIEAFFAESPGHAETFSQLIAAISNGENVQQNIEAAQRIAHTLKGSGNLVGLRGIANLAHHIEDIFEYVARHKIQPPQVLSDAMQEAADCIESMLEFLQGVAPPPDDAQRVLQEVLDWANRIDSGNLRRADSTGDEAEVAVEATDDAAKAEAEEEEINDRRKKPETEELIAATRNESVRVPLRVLDNIFRVVSETAITTGQIQERLNRLENNEKMIRKNDGSLQQMRYELESLVSIRGMAARHRSSAGDGSKDFDPLEMDEYDEFYGATHSYIEAVADSREILRSFTSEVYELNALFLLQQRLNKELQQVVMTTRMVQVSMISARLQRAVRQACRATGKQAELSIFGQDLLLDGDVLNKLADPLMHMLRNAVDHGIEDTERRTASGKPGAGQISLSFQQEGNSVVVRCIDDGAGLNYERIRETAIEKQLINERDTVDNPALARMILQSGFSTSDQVTQVSGRGVGMDVVHNTIQSLNGGMEIEDAAENGTQILLRVPITLLTSHCLLAGVGRDKIFAIPTISLTQILSPGTGKIGRVGECLSYQLGKEVYDACSLNSLVGIAEEHLGDNIEKCSVLLVQSSAGVTALTVDRVVTSYDLVVKNMGAYVKNITGVAGVSMLGDGTVVTVLDPSALLQSRNSASSDYRATSNIAAASNNEAVMPKVLIVDDSLSVRSSLSQLVNDRGYRVVAARDGLEAVNLLEAEAPDIILTDLEMPRMNGLDLASYVRKSTQWNHLPIVMITSRTMAKHREQAELVGINRYITKPFTEDEVLSSIDDELAVAL
ncbi:MAG: response regulator [Gammaproteobacteria bacterium]|nr:response regulator [Gammaproteobacteria bacterium]